MKNPLFLLCLLLSFAITKAEAGPSVYYGAFASDLPGFETSAGKNVSVKNTFKAWGGSWSAFSAPTMDGIRSQGSIPMITWEPWAAGLGVNQSNYTLQKIISGYHDAYINQFAQDAKTWGKPFFIRLAHEMNGNWYPWCEGVNGNAPGSYVQAWRHIHNIFKLKGVTNVTWAWVPNVIYTGSTPLAGLYPGDAYVHWTGFDVYNMKATNFRPFKTLATPTYLSLLAIAPSKPIVVAETSSVEAGGSKPLWITEALNSLTTDFPKIGAFFWFNENKEENWKIESSAASQAAFRAGIASSKFATNTFANYNTSPIPALSSAPAPTIPAAPSNLVGSAISYSQIKLSWKDNAFNETGVEIKRATDPAFTLNVSWRVQNTVNLQTIPDPGLAAYTTYYYKVRALNAVGKSAYSNTIVVKTPRRYIIADPALLSPVKR